MGASRKGRGPTEEELLLWKQATRHDKKLRGAKEIPSEVPKAPKIAKKTSAPLPQPRIKETTAPLVCGNYSVMDGSMAKRLKRGDYPVGRTLDLHGMQRTEAYDTLRNTLEQAYHAHMRCLLVITGKGRAGEGVLRGLLGGWLNDAPLRPLVVAFGEAAARHGGSGAFYVLIRRRKKG